jgi:hypothetical protein
MKEEPDSEAQHDDTGRSLSLPLSTESSLCNSQLSKSPNASSYEDKYKLLRGSSMEKGPSAFRKQSSFGGTFKLKPANDGESTIQIEKGTYHSHANKVTDVKKYNHLGQTLGRMNIVDSFGVLLVPPGPTDYRPLTEKRSTQRSDPHWSFYDRDKYKGSVDALNTPGPGSYAAPPSIKQKEPYIIRHEKTKVVKSVDKIGPGSYDVRRTAEMATQRFHRETAAHMAKRDNGSKTREILDFNTLKVKKNKQIRLKDADRNKKSRLKDEKSHLGPGAYFPLESEVPPCITFSSESTLPIRRKFDHDPDIPSTPVHTFGVRRPDFRQGRDQHTPGPGEYDYMASLYGSQPLLEAGGAVSRPGKSCRGTTDSEGAVKGQHANIDFATKFIPALPTMKSTVKIGDTSSSGKWVSNGERKQERANAYKSPYACAHKVVQRRQRLVGRGGESTAQDLPFKFSGRQSTGAFFQFH